MFGIKRKSTTGASRPTEIHCPGIWLIHKQTGGLLLATHPGKSVQQILKMYPDYNYYGEAGPA